MKITVKQLRKIIKEEVQRVQKKSNLNESMSRITQDELAQWKSGNWGYVSESEEVREEIHNQIMGHRSAGGPSDYEACDICGWDHEYDFPYLDFSDRRKAMSLHGEDDYGEGMADYMEDR